MDNETGDTRIDFLQCLETDMSLYVMNFLDDPADLVRASAVSRFWRQFVIANGLAKKLCFKAYPQLSNTISAISPTGGMRSASAVKILSDWENHKRDYRVYASLLQALTKSKVSPGDCIADAVSASSTDNYPDESVTNTLNPRDRFIRRPSYWSSKGHSDPAVPETIVYKLRGGLLVITEVDIQPFEAFFQPGNPIYSAKSVRFRVGHPVSSKDIVNDREHLPLQKPLDDIFAWTYTSPEFPMMQDNRLQPFKLPEPVLCMDGFLQIELLGRVQRQEVDGLFYLCVCYVRVLGRPLFPAFVVEELESHGKVLLMHFPENMSCVMDKSSNTEKSLICTS